MPRLVPFIRPIVHRTIPFARQLRALFREARHGRRENQSLLERRTHSLVRVQSPALAGRATPRATPSTLTVPDLDFNYTDDGAQMHRSFPAIPSVSNAEGGELRHGGRLLLVAHVPAAGASTRALRPALPSQFRLTNGGHSHLS